METVLQFFIIGLGSGGMYALGALGIVIIYRGSGVVNFAHGATATVGAFTYWEVVQSTGSDVLALIAGVAAAAVLGAAFQLIVLSRMQDASALARMVATLGLLTA